jgi:hypothetical protein
LTASLKTVLFAKKSGAASRTTMTPGAVAVPLGASSSSESVGSPVEASTSIAGSSTRSA